MAKKVIHSYQELQGFHLITFDFYDDFSYRIREWEDINEYGAWRYNSDSNTIEWWQQSFRSRKNKKEFNTEWHWTRWSDRKEEVNLINALMKEIDDTLIKS